MSSATQYAQKKILDHALALAAFTMPTCHMGLFTTTPGETGSLAGEVAGGSYARVELSSKMAATVTATGIAANTSPVTFPTPTADWGLVQHWGICDASSSGNVLFYGDLIVPQPIFSGAAGPVFQYGAVQLLASSAVSYYATRYLAAKALDHVLGIAAFTIPTATYLTLHSADPGATGSPLNEISTGSYTRQNLTGSLLATVLATGMSTNTAAVTFTAGAAWAVTHFGLADASTTGNLLFRRARGSTMNVSNTSAGVRFASGTVSFKAA